MSNKQLQKVTNSITIQSSEHNNFSGWLVTERWAKGDAQHSIADLVIGALSIPLRRRPVPSGGIRNQSGVKQLALSSPPPISISIRTHIRTLRPRSAYINAPEMRCAVPSCRRNCDPASAAANVMHPPPPPTPLPPPTPGVISRPAYSADLLINNKTPPRPLSSVELIKRAVSKLFKRDAPCSSSQSLINRALDCHDVNRLLCSSITQ